MLPSYQKHLYCLLSLAYMIGNLKLINHVLYRLSHTFFVYLFSQSDQLSQYLYRGR